MKRNAFIRIFALVLVLLLCFSAVGCRKNTKVYSYYVSDDEPGAAEEKSDKKNEDKKGGEDGEDTASGSKSGSKDKKDDKGGKTSAGAYNTKGSAGTVTVALNSARPTDFAPLLDALAKAYPDIRINIDYFSHERDSQEYIAAKSATGTLPDIVFDDIANLPLYVGQGLLYPLNSYLAKDPEYKSVPANIMKDYTYGGEVYALPHQAYFTACIMNTDALDALNVDLPNLDWGVDEFKEFCKACAKKVGDKQYCACERLFYLDYYGSGMFSKTAGICGYNSDTRTFEMTNSFAKAEKLFRELRQIPNVEAWMLRGDGQYEKNFGSTDDWASLLQGRSVMLDFEKGTYSKTYYDELCTGFNWTFWPYPQGIKGRMPIHIDHAFMLANAKNPDLAFKVLSFMTYSKAGNLARIKAYQDKANGKGKYKLNLDYYTPITNNADVVKAYKKLVNDDEVQMYLYSNISNCYRGDPDKIYPSFGQNWADVINPVAMRMQDGLKDPDSTCKDLQIKATKALKVYWDDFEAKLAKVQKNWKATH